MSENGDLRLEAIPRGATDPAPRFAGRRLRTFFRLLSSSTNTSGGLDVMIGPAKLYVPEQLNTVGAVYQIAALTPFLRAALSALPFRSAFSSFKEDRAVSIELLRAEVNAELSLPLQDLGDEIIMDISEACASLDDPDCWYEGIDTGIEPVSDDHVELVIAALQRELRRETRVPIEWKGPYDSSQKLPVVILAELPFRVQRALVERRRLRFAQWGIHKKQWEQDRWSLWEVHEGAGWRPRYAPVHQVNIIPDQADDAGMMPYDYYPEGV